MKSRGAGGGEPRFTVAGGLTIEPLYRFLTTDDTEYHGDFHGIREPFVTLFR